MTTFQLKDLLDEFLNRWQIDDLERMSLNEYVGVNNKDTFCQWVETKTRMLGSIKGMTSIKFGIYERKDPNKNPKNYSNDERYSWLKDYGENRQEAFVKVKNDVLKIVDFAGKGKFHQIDKIRLPNLFKWKVAFLYSNERLIPIYKSDVLFKIAEHYGLKTNRQTQISEIQELMIENKPSQQDVYEFMRNLYEEFGRGEDKKLLTGKESLSKKKREKGKRKGATNRNTESHTRTITRSFIVEQKHNKIQKELSKNLIDEYGEENVVLEENYVDVKLLQEDYLGFYEVKSSPYASECIKEALGQVLLYTHKDEDSRPKKIYVVGQYPANEQDRKYIEFIKQSLNLEFDYINVEIQ